MVRNLFRHEFKFECSDLDTREFFSDLKATAYYLGRNLAKKKKEEIRAETLIRPDLAQTATCRRARAGGDISNGPGGGRLASSHARGAELHAAVRREIFGAGRVRRRRPPNGSAAAT